MQFDNTAFALRANVGLDATVAAQAQYAAWKGQRVPANAQSGNSAADRRKDAGEGPAGPLRQPSQGRVVRLSIQGEGSAPATGAKGTGRLAGNLVAHLFGIEVSRISASYMIEVRETMAREKFEADLRELHAEPPFILNANSGRGGPSFATHLISPDAMQVEGRAGVADGSGVRREVEVELRMSPRAFLSSGLAERAPELARREVFFDSPDPAEAFNDSRFSFEVSLGGQEHETVTGAVRFRDPAAASGLAESAGSEDFRSEQLFGSIQLLLSASKPRRAPVGSQGGGGHVGGGRLPAEDGGMEFSDPRIAGRLVREMIALNQRAARYVQAAAPRSDDGSEAREAERPQALSGRTGAAEQPMAVLRAGPIAVDDASSGQTGVGTAKPTVETQPGPDPAATF